MTIKHRTVAQRVSAALKLTGVAAMALSFITMLALAGCPTETDPDPGQTTGRTYTVTANGSATEATTTLTITFAEAESGLAAGDITLTDDTGAATIGALSGSGTDYTLGVTVTQGGTITVMITKDGVDSSGHSVTVYKPVPTGRTYTVSADGSATEATTQLTITFDAAEDGLTATHITLTNGTGNATKNGELGGTALVYTLPVTVTQEGSITVNITKDGVDSNDHSVEVKKPAAPADGPFETVAEAITYLNSKNKGGSAPEAAVLLKMKIDLGATTGDDTLVELLGKIGKMFNDGTDYTPNYVVRYIKLDLSECTVTGDTIATGKNGDYQYGEIGGGGGYYTEHYGALSVVEMKLPACKIPAGVYYSGNSPQSGDAVGLKRFSNLKKISGGATEAGANAFPASLTTVDLPDLVTIGVSAFSGCGGLTRISFPELTAIPNYAFSETGLTKVESDDIPKVVSIGNSAFRQCAGLETFSAGDATISIGTDAFRGANPSRLTAVSLPKVTAISNSAFYGCTILASVYIPEAGTIGNSAFAYCGALESVSFPLATTIGDSAFLDCQNLAWADLSKAESFGKKAFGTTDYAGKLATLILGAAPPTLPVTGTNNVDGIFATTASSASSTDLTVYVPNGKKGDYTTAWSVSETTNSNSAPAKYGAKHPKVDISDDTPPEEPSAAE